MQQAADVCCHVAVSIYTKLVQAAAHSRIVADAIYLIMVHCICLCYLLLTADALDGHSRPCSLWDLASMKAVTKAI